MTWNVNFDARPILEHFVIALSVVSQPLNRTTQQVLHLILRLKSYLENHFIKIIPAFC